MATFTATLSRKVKAEGLVEGSIDDSIAKWEFIRDHLDEIDPGEDGGPSTCALCHKYFHAHCDQCPVSEYTGLEFCDGTPYKDWEELYSDENPDEIMKIVKKEVAFLKRLKRKMEKKP